jgi:dTDP-4-amino-4,6-dideoxygalactose transaminase
MWVRKRIDIGYSDIAYGMLRACLPADREKLQRRVEETWSADDALACLSVRTGFDLLFDALELPAKSEILIFAVTIRDMVRIVEDHGLTPVPLDFEPDDLAPRLETIRQAITPQTKAIVVTHLFGARVDVEPILRLAREHNLLVIEDCAQGYVGPDYTGHPESDVTMFSFGTIKTNTALGGAVLGVRNKELRRRMRERQASYPVQRRWSYFCRLMKYAGVKAISTRPGLSVSILAFRAAGAEYDQVANHMARGFPGGGFFERIRHQPSAPLLAVLDRRLKNFDPRRFERRVRMGQRLADMLQGRFKIQGQATSGHSYWVFPILVDEPRRVISLLWKAGFDATQGASLWVVDPPESRPELEPASARRAVDKTVYLPLYTQMPMRALERMAQALMAESSEQGAEATNGERAVPKKRAGFFSAAKRRRNGRSPSEKPQSEKTRRRQWRRSVIGR